MTYQKERARHEQMSCFFFCPFKSNIRETWRMILVSKADIFLSESLRILAERLSQSEIRLPLRQICYYSPSEEVGVFSTEIKKIEYGVQSVFLRTLTEKRLPLYIEETKMRRNKKCAQTLKIRGF